MRPSPTYRRKRTALARQLRHLREMSGNSGNRFAKRLGWAQSKVSRIETGVQLPSENDILEWSDALKLPKGEFGALLQMLEQAESEYSSWMSSYHTAGSSKNKQIEIKQLESDSKSICEFQLCLIPGLLQTLEYAASVLTAKFGPTRFGASTDDVSDTIAVRMERQAIIHDETKELSFVLPEAGLRTKISSELVQRAQTQRIIDIARFPNVKIGIIPFANPIPLIPLNGFCIYDDDMVVIETLSGEQQLSTASDVDLYRQAFEACMQASVTGDYAIEYIRTICLEP